MKVTVRWWREPDGQWWRRIEADGDAMWGLCEPQDEPELLVDIADYLQEQVFDGQGSEPWGKAWPECPGHPHPPDPTVINGVAVWVCPRDGRVLAPIGQLAAA